MQTVPGKDNKLKAQLYLCHTVLNTSSHLSPNLHIPRTEQHSVVSSQLIIFYELHVFMFSREI